MTASTPRRVPSGSRTTGMPPPPWRPRRTRPRRRARTAGGVEDLERLGRGDDPAPALLAAVLPGLAVLDQHLRPRSAGRNRPIGLVGSGEARVVGATRVAGDQGRRAPRRRRGAASAASSAFISTKPSVAWVCAPHQSSGTGGTTAAASSFLTSRLPTWGPLPWVSTTSTSCCEQVGDRGHRDVRPRRSGPRDGLARRRRHGVAAEREQDPHASNLVTRRDQPRHTSN